MNRVGNGLSRQETGPTCDQVLGAMRTYYISIPHNASNCSVRSTYGQHSRVIESANKKHESSQASRLLTVMNMKRRKLHYFELHYV